MIKQTKNVIRQHKLDRNLYLTLTEEHEHFDDGEEDEIIFVIELEFNKETSIHLCENYNKDTAEVLFALIRDNISSYVDFSLFSVFNNQIVLKTDENKINKEDS